MKLLTLGVVLFAAIHLLPGAVALRQTLLRLLGEKIYKGLFSLLTFAAIGLMVVGYREGEWLDIYIAPSWGKSVTAILMLASMILFAAANMPTNLKRYTRHPMLWGLVVWGVAHLFSNGDKASLILFGGLACYGLLAMWSANRRGAQKQTERLPGKMDIKPILAGAVAYVIFIALHPYLFGVAVF